MTRINPVLRIIPRNAAAASGLNAIGVSGSNGSFSAQTITFGNSNGVSFYSTNGSIVASVIGGTGGGVADGFNSLVAGTQTGNSTGSIIFSNSNGISFGMSNNSVITAAHNAITTARASTDAIGLNTAGTNITWTVNSSGLSINAGGYAGTGFTSTTTAGVDIKGTNNTAGLSVAIPAFLTTAQPVGAYLTTAAQSNQVVNSLNGSTGVMSLTVASSLSFSSNGSTISFGLASNITTALQSTGAYLTTQSGQAFSADASSTFQTLSFQNSNGISFSNNAGALRVTHDLQFTSNTSNITSNALHTSASRVINIVAATNSTGGGTASLSSNVSFSNANGVSFYTSAGSAVVGSVVTSYRASNDGIGLNTAKTNVTWTVNSSGLSLDAGGYAGTGTSATNASITMNTNGLAISVAAPAAGVGIAASTRTATTANVLLFDTGNGITFGLNAVGGSIMTASHNAITTGRASTDAIGLNTAKTNVTWTVNSSGLSLDASGYAGTGTSKTGGAVITLNSNGMAFDGGALAGTATTFNGVNISGSMTVNTAGVNLSMSVAPGGGATPVASASNGSFSFTTLGFSNANNVTFGTSAGSIITASVAAPGAAAENNWVNLLGANTAGNTTASGSTIGFSGINLTLSGTNNSAINISAPATSSLVGTNGVSISTNGSTITIQREIQKQYWNANNYYLNSQSNQALASTFNVFPFTVQNNVSFDFLRLLNTVSIASTSFASTANTTYSYNQAVSFRGVLYTRNTGASSMSLASVSTLSAGLTYSMNAAYGSATNTSQFFTIGITHPYSTGTTNTFTTTYGTSNLSTQALSTGGLTVLTGFKFLDIPFAGSLTPGIYWMALNASTTQTTQGTAGLSGARLLYSTIAMSQPNNTFAVFGQANNASIQAMLGVGSFTTAAGGSTGSMGFSNISSSASHVVPFFTLSQTSN